MRVWYNIRRRGRPRPVKRSGDGLQFKKGRKMNWLLLFLAGVFEVVWAVALKYSHGFTRVVPAVVTALGMALSTGLLALAMKTIPLGTAYAIWTGIGAVGGIVAGCILFGEPHNAMRIIFASFIVVGIVGLKLCAR